MISAGVGKADSGLAVADLVFTSPLGPASEVSESETKITPRNILIVLFKTT